jgi:hypothetical protein
MCKPISHYRQEVSDSRHNSIEIDLDDPASFGQMCEMCRRATKLLGLILAYL